MEDQELRVRYNEAADQKEQVGILAELNGVSVWEMRNKLVELGCSVDGRWFQNQNPNRTKPAVPKTTATEEEALRELRALRKDLQERIQTIETLELTVAQKERQLGDLEARLSDKDAAAERLTAQLDAMSREREALVAGCRDEVERLNAALLEARDRCETLQDAAEAPKPTELSDVINAFVDGRSGFSAYLWGRLIDAIWCARFLRQDTLSLAEGLCGQLRETEYA